jgi:general secretion pathway protein I
LSLTSNLQPATCCNLHPCSGFTLLEVMVAVSIMAIVLVAVYRLHSQTISMNIAAKFYTSAPLLAQGKLAEFEIMPADKLTGDSGDFGENFPGYYWNVAVEDVESEPLGEAAKGLKRLDVTVTLNNEFSYSFRTYRFAEE